jgi:hypothetical protein
MVMTVVDSDTELLLRGGEGERTPPEQKLLHNKGTLLACEAVVIN